MARANDLNQLFLCNETSIIPKRMGFGEFRVGEHMEIQGKWHSH